MTVDEAKAKVLRLAESELGYREQGNNITKYATLYDFDNKLYSFDMNGQPWCDYFFDWLFMKCFGYEIGSAMTYQFSGCSGAACAASASYYRSNGAFFSSPEVGDQIFFYVNGDINHTGIVESIGNGYITTIEGNSSDMVQRNKYPFGHSTIAGFGRPKWKYAESVPVDGLQNVADGVETETNVISRPVTKLSQNTIKMGSVGWEVTALQAMLNYYGAGLDADGEFGKLTQQALIEYQKANRDSDGEQLEVDGVCGIKTWRSLL